MLAKVCFLKSCYIRANLLVSSFDIRVGLLRNLILCHSWIFVVSGVDVWGGGCFSLFLVVVSDCYGLRFVVCLAKVVLHDGGTAEHYITELVFRGGLLLLLLTSALQIP